VNLKKNWCFLHVHRGGTFWLCHVLESCSDSTKQLLAPGCHLEIKGSCLRKQYTCVQLCTGPSKGAIGHSCAVTHSWVWLLHTQAVPESQLGACTKPQRPRLFPYPNVPLNLHPTKWCSRTHIQEDHLLWNKKADSLLLAL
jgi:hypothetical protein